ncbi:caspase family protein [Streptomyces aurantiacus]|uniref:Peptidase C14 caspase domain-containing protein n=1 Tax=Streptomyces aurantiacus JA 4570 TaxID=1286094 RepID=S3ZVW5_9ACTN|nr:caspase family protein [Streptomyces aurantiacus]EPH46914.1 hypothetical protein STRAU_0080 [Streptomyces aurantiacus JA 4570]
MRLPDPHRSYAVLIGTSTYRSSQLADLPAVSNNLRDLAAVLTDPNLGGVPQERCIIISDPADARTVYRILRRYARAAEDTLIVYFAGHGQTGLRNELYLGLTDTDPDELRVSALEFDLIRDVLIDCPAVNRVVILDCCFSGRAIQDMSGEEEAILGQVAVEGTYVLASTPVNSVALAPVGASHTAFTGELIQLLRTGVPGGPELLTYGEIYRRLLHATTLRGLPSPRQRGTGTVDLLALVRNAAASAEAPVPAAVAGHPVVPSRIRQKIIRPLKLQPTSLTNRKPMGDWKILRNIGWIALFATWLYGLGQISTALFLLIESAASPTLTLSFRELVTGDPGHEITLVDITLPLFNMLVGSLIFRFTRRDDARSWVGVCALLGYGTADAAGIPFAIAVSLYEPNHLYHSIFPSPEVIIAGRALLAIAAVAALVTVVRTFPSVKIGLPARRGMPFVILVLALMVAYVAFVICWHTNIRVLEDDVTSRLIRCVVISLLAILLPVGGLAIQSRQLGAGLAAGWLAFSLSIEIQFISTLGYDDSILRSDASLWIEHLLLGLMNLGLFCAYYLHLRERRPS